jgi:hypothetical protein
MFRWPWPFHRGSGKKRAQKSGGKQMTLRDVFMREGSHPIGETSHCLIVRRDTGMFVLLEIENGVTTVAVQAPNAQMIQDYLNANWPVGTVAQWIVVPPFQAVRAESAGREAGRGFYGPDPGLCLHSSARASSSGRPFIPAL